MSGASLSLRSKSRRRIFHPSFVPEIAAGYWWEAIAAVGLGTSAFRVPEGNGHTSFDLPQSTVASQPTQLTENGGVQFRMRKAADANPSIMGTAAGVAHGWTGPSYIGGWWRWPNGVTSGSNNFFVQSAAGQRRVAIITGTASSQLSSSADGTAQQTNAWPSPVLDGNWHWCEWFITPGVDVVQAKDLVVISRTTTVTPGASLFDANTLLAIGCRIGVGLANVDNTDWAAVYDGNGFPSLANRVQLANRRNPTGILLAA